MTGPMLKPDVPRGTLWEAPAQRHSSTSVAAAKSIVPHLPRLERVVYDWLKEHGPSTDEEMQVGIPMAPSTQRPRRVGLVARGLVIDTGSERPTSSGRNASVWATANMKGHLND